MKKPFEIVFEDEYIVVLNKKVKIVIQQTAKKEKNTLTNLLARELNKKVYPCHRLDKETTGLIVYAKSQKIQQEIMNQFKNRIVEKKYYAFAKGKLKAKKGVIESFIQDSYAKKFGDKPKKAITHYRVLKDLNGFSLVELKPKTGRTNQLRIHLAKMGNPILGERKYAFGKDFKIKFKRVALHAFFIKFIHPVSKKVVELLIDMPSDMKDFLI